MVKAWTHIAINTHKQAAVLTSFVSYKITKITSRLYHSKLFTQSLANQHYCHPFFLIASSRCSVMSLVASQDFKELLLIGLFHALVTAKIMNE